MDQKEAHLLAPLLGRAFYGREPRFGEPVGSSSMVGMYTLENRSEHDYVDGECVIDFLVRDHAPYVSYLANRAYQEGRAGRREGTYLMKEGDLYFHPKDSKKQEFLMTGEKDRWIEDTKTGIGKGEAEWVAEGLNRIYELGVADRITAEK